MTEKSWQKASKRLEIKLSPELHGRWTAFCEERGQASASAAIRDLMAHVVDDPKLAYWTNAKSRFDKNPAAKHKGDWALLRIEPGLMNEWRAHCHRVHERPSVHVSDLMRAQMKQQQDRELAITSYVNDLGPDRSRSRQITLRVSDTEYAALVERGASDGLTPAKWITKLVRVGLTNEPALSVDELEVLTQTCEQIRRIGVNFFSMVKRVRFQKRNPQAHEIAAGVKIVEGFKEWQGQISDLVWGNVRRWHIVDADEARAMWENSRPLKPWSRRAKNTGFDVRAEIGRDVAHAQADD